MQGEQVLNMNSADFGRVLEGKDNETEKEFENVLNKPLFAEYILNNRASAETYQDEARVRITTTRIADINYADHAKRMFKKIEEMSS